MSTKQESIAFLIASIMNISTETIPAFIITLMTTFENFTAFLLTQKLRSQRHLVAFGTLDLSLATMPTTQG